MPLGVTVISQHSLPTEFTGISVSFALVQESDIDFHNVATESQINQSAVVKIAILTVDQSIPTVRVVFSLDSLSKHGSREIPFKPQSQNPNEIYFTLFSNSKHLCLLRAGTVLSTAQVASWKPPHLWLLRQVSTEPEQGHVPG